jgi:hypothetical protein
LRKSFSAKGFEQPGEDLYRDWSTSALNTSKSRSLIGAEIESLLNDSMFEKIRSDPRLLEMLSKIGVSLDHHPFDSTKDSLPEKAIEI